MSASTQKKLRKQQREEGTDKRLTAQQIAERKAKRAKTRNTIVGILVVLLIVAILVLNSNLFYRNFDAVTVGGESYSAAEVSFVYYSTYYNYVNTYGTTMLGYMGLDPSKPLKSQAYGEDMTWADFFRDMAINSLQSTTMFWSEAQKAGYTLSDEQQAELEELLADIDTVHESSNSGFADANKFFSANYGKGVNTEIVAKIMERSYIAGEYQQHITDSFEYSDKELADWYSENEDNSDIFNFLSVFINGEANEEEGIDAETAMAEARETADSIVGDKPITDADIPADEPIDDETDEPTDGESGDDTDDNTADEPEADDDTASEAEKQFSQRALALTQSDPTSESKAGSSLSEVYAEWLKDSSRKEGDKTVIESETGCYALYFISRDNNDYATKNVRHILIRATADSDGAYTDEAKKAAEDEAKSLLAEWKSGAATEDSFAELAEEKSGDSGSNQNGGLYENVPQGRMVSEFDQWIYDESRKPGDTGIVFNEDSNYCGYHIMYFVGDGDNYRDVLADSSLRSDDFSEWQTASLENYPVTRGFTLGLVK